MAKILVVEDSPTFVAMLRNALEDRGFDIQATHDALSTFALIDDYQPDLIMLDIGLPGGVDGIQLCSAIRMTSTTAKTPIIMLTGSRNRVNIKLSETLGANEYLTKPVDFPKLYAAIDRCLQPDDTTISGSSHENLADLMY